MNKARKKAFCSEHSDTSTSVNRLLFIWKGTISETEAVELVR
jgi:hypothetical protein